MIANLTQIYSWEKKNGQRKHQYSENRRIVDAEMRDMIIKTDIVCAKTSH